jgi:phosphoglycolate phosphatase
VAQLLLRGEPIGSEGRGDQIRAVLFDKDGTLSISEPKLLALARARLSACLSKLRQQRPELASAVAADLDQFLGRAYGLLNGGLHPAGITAVASRDHNLISTATALVQVGLGWPEAVELAEAVFEITDPLAGSGPGSASEVTPGLHGLLRSLSDAGLSCAVISNDDQRGIEAFLQSHSIAHHFQGLWSAEHSPRKPNPAAVHALCGELGVAPEHCALIGDANSDLRMARAAGVAVVIGYSAAWSSEPPLDPQFPRLDHWDQLTVMAA